MKHWILSALLFCGAMAVNAGELCRWVDPESGNVRISQEPPPYPIKETQEGGSLPNGPVLKVILDENSPQYKAAVVKRKAAEPEKKRIAEEQAKRDAEQQRLTQEKEEQQKRRIAEAVNREATDEEAQECVALLKKNYSFKDPESLRVDGGRSIVLYKDGERFISLEVNAKNGYGDYVGAKPVYCTYKPGAAPKVDTYWGD